MGEQSKRYRAFVSYSQRDGAAARRLHRALERYRVPKGIEARVGSDRSLGRFFRDDDEMGASQSLGAALEGALDDSEALIVVCSPSAARSNWVDAEIRHFKARVDARVLPVIADGEPHARDPDRECFPPALKVKIGPDGEPTGEADEPRAPDLRREGLRRVRCQLAAGLLGLPFDDLWRRDRRRARQVRLAIGAVALVVVAVLGIAGLGWLGAQSEARTRAATQALARARVASADGRLGEALTGLAPFLDTRETRALVEPPLRALLGWVTDPEARLAGEGLQPVRLRDATALLDPARGVYDVSDAGLQLRRLIRSRDGERLVVVGDQRVIVFGAKSGQRLAESENGRVEWIGHALEAPSELLVVTGAILGPTNGSVSPWALAISADGTRVERHQIPAHMFWGSAAGVAPECAALLVATEENDGSWQVERRAFDATGLRSPVPELDVAPGRRGDSAGIDALSRLGSGFATQAAFMGEAEQNPFALAGCATPAVDDGFALGGSDSPGPRVVSLDLGLSFEPAESWEPGPTRGDGPSPPATYLPDCTEALAPSSRPARTRDPDRG